MKKYDPVKIEKKWQKFWESKKTFKAKEEGNKKYILFEFPYPSGAGLHVGHMRPYVATDVVSRYFRLKNFNVLYPMGWDAFGLPAENFAIKNKIHPSVATKRNVANAKRQMQMMGLSLDWSREINTTDPDYYKWTQKIFLEFFKAGLAYEKFGEINWCPQDLTGLANEEVVDGKCERCGSIVEKKNLRQWYLKITDYAEKLLEGLKELPEWPEAVKIQQENWIGKSVGTQIKFPISNTQFSIEVFTTRADTLFGVTYLALAPEHNLITNGELQITNLKEVQDYVEKAKRKTDIERGDNKEKTGVEIKGIKAINPANGEEIPIYVADYVLPQYGTGAVMAVPAHDERDFEFAKKYNLPIKRVVEPKFVIKDGDAAFRDSEPVIKRECVCVVVHNPKTNKYLCISWRDHKMHGLVTGGLENDEDVVDAAKREVREETGYKNLKLVKDPKFALHTFFYHRIKKVNRHARFQYIFLELENEEKDHVSEEEAKICDVVWLSKNEIKNFFTVAEGEFTVNFINNPDYIFSGYGIINDSGKFNYLESEEAIKKITAEYGTLNTKYKLRDWVFSRQRYWGEPIPLIHCEKCGVVAVPEKDLPVVLPKVKKYEPTGTGESPLAGIEKWVNVKCPQCGGAGKRETNTMPQWAGSSWYWLRYMDPKNKKEIASLEAQKYWSPVDLYFGGMEHTTLHLLYSRFWNLFLYDRGLVAVKEPYKKRVPHGIILGPDNEKMSKSRGNIVNPDEVVSLYGADTVRLYMMFLGPHGAQVAWNDKGIIGTRRFLDRVWNMQEFLSKEENGEVTKALHKMIKKVSEDIEEHSFNTAVSAMMIFANTVYEAKSISRASYEAFLKILSPFSPHLCEELWGALGNKKSIYTASWPEWEEKYLTEDKVTMMIQINGKVRGQIEVGANATDEEVTSLALSNEKTAPYLEGKEVKKRIIVKGKIINFVI